MYTLIKSDRGEDPMKSQQPLKGACLRKRKLYQ